MLTGPRTEESHAGRESECRTLGERMSGGGGEAGREGGMVSKDAAVRNIEILEGRPNTGGVRSQPVTQCG
jgi:hypothetical protein